MRFIYIFFLFSLSNLFAQLTDPIQRTQLIGTETSFSYRTREVFYGFGYTQQFKKIALSSGINLGVKSTFSQSSIFPQLQFKFAYFPIIQSNSKDILFFGPQIQLKTGVQRVFNLHSFSDLLIGYDFSYGQKWRFYHALSCGPYLEFFKNENRKIYHVTSLNYYLTFGLHYAL